MNDRPSEVPPETATSGPFFAKPQEKTMTYDDNNQYGKNYRIK